MYDFEFRNNFDHLQRSLGCCSFTDGSSVASFTNPKHNMTETCSSKNQICDLCYPDSCYVQYKAGKFLFLS